MYQKTYILTKKIVRTSCESLLAVNLLLSTHAISFSELDLTVTVGFFLKKISVFSYESKLSYSNN